MNGSRFSALASAVFLLASISTMSQAQTSGLVCHIPNDVGGAVNAAFPPNTNPAPSLGAPCYDNIHRGIGAVGTVVQGAATNTPYPTSAALGSDPIGAAAAGFACRFTAGPLSGSVLQPIGIALSGPANAPCSDNYGSTGVQAAPAFACNFTQGAMKGMTVMPTNSALSGPAGQPCSDGYGNAGTQVVHPNAAH